MVEERDFAGIGIPFAAGVTAGIISTETLAPGLAHSLASLSCAAAVVLAAAMAASPGKCRHPVYPRLMAAVTFLACGFFCALNSRIIAGIGATHGTGIGGLAQRACGSLKQVIDAIPYSEEGTGALVKALLTGDRSGLDKETTACFRAAGASHILALSGLHLGLLHLILTKLTAPLGNSSRARVARYSVTVGFAGFYCLMTGAGPSIVRAFLFILLSQTATLLGREKPPVLILLGALTLQLAMKPDVVQTLGFQLSYLAMVGIFTLYPALEKIYPQPEREFWRKLDPFRRLWNGAMLSISCQVFTAPLVWARFRTFPKFFLITNMTALPLTSAVMAVSVATIALSAFGICPMSVVHLDETLIQTLISALRTVSELDSSSWT